MPRLTPLPELPEFSEFTKLAFRDFLVPKGDVSKQLTCSEINDLFGAAGLTRKPLPEGKEVNGDRRTLIEEYYHGVNWSSKFDKLKVLRLFKEILRRYNNPANLIEVLQNDGFDLAASAYPSGPAEQSVSTATGRTTDKWVTKATIIKNDQSGTPGNKAIEYFSHLNLPPDKKIWLINQPPPNGGCMVKIEFGQYEGEVKLNLFLNVVERFQTLIRSGAYSPTREYGEIEFSDGSSIDGEAFLSSLGGARLDRKLAVKFFEDFHLLAEGAVMATTTDLMNVARATMKLSPGTDMKKGAYDQWRSNFERFLKDRYPGSLMEPNLSAVLRPMNFKKDENDSDIDAGLKYGIRYLEYIELVDDKSSWGKAGSKELYDDLPFSIAPGEVFHKGIMLSDVQPTTFISELIVRLAPSRISLISNSTLKRGEDSYFLLFSNGTGIYVSKRFPLIIGGDQGDVVLNAARTALEKLSGKRADTSIGLSDTTEKTEKSYEITFSANQKDWEGFLSYLKSAFDNYGQPVQNQALLADGQGGVMLTLGTGTWVKISRAFPLIVDGKDSDIIADLVQKTWEEFMKQGETGQKKVFVVYGRNNPAKNQLETILRRWDLEPLIIEQLPSKGQTLIEKIEKYRKEAVYAVVLATPDDVGCLAVEHSRNKKKGVEKLKRRARQNVILELGMVLAHLGRERVAIIYKDIKDFEKPSDIDGLHYIPYKNRFDEIVEKLRRELMAASIPLKEKVE